MRCIFIAWQYRWSKGVSYSGFFFYLVGDFVNIFLLSSLFFFSSLLLLELVRIGSFPFRCSVLSSNVESDQFRVYIFFSFFSFLSFFNWELSWMSAAGELAVSILFHLEHFSRLSLTGGRTKLIYSVSFFFLALTPWPLTSWRCSSYSDQNIKSQIPHRRIYSIVQTLRPAFNEGQPTAWPQTRNLFLWSETNITSP